MFESDAVTITYTNFLLLAHLETPHDWKLGASRSWDAGLRFDADGVWIGDEAANPLLDDSERDDLIARHPDGDPRKPIVTFPATLGALRKRLSPFMGGWYPNPYELADIVAAWRPRAPSKWPWGDHDTEYLRALEAAGNRFWGEGYDPDDPDTANTNETVEEWLSENFDLSAKAASVMATILRDQRLSKGRPRKKG